MRSPVAGSSAAIVFLLPLVTLGIGILPRGEVTLIFASIGLSAHVISDSLYAAIILVVVLTTFVTPPLLKAVTGTTVAKGGEEMATSPEPPMLSADPIAETA